FHMPMSSPMMTRMLGRAAGAGVCAIAGVVAHNPIATVDANSFARNDCRLSSPLALIVCPFAAKGRSELLPAQAQHPLAQSGTLCRFGRNRARTAPRQSSSEMFLFDGRTRPAQRHRWRFAEQTAISDREAAKLPEAMRR